MTGAEWLACKHPGLMLEQLTGCDNPDILHHLRSPGPHVRGCWALDLVLGNE